METNLIVMASFYLFAGISHFLTPRFFIKMMPAFIPDRYHKAIVAISGIIEITLATLLFFEQSRSFAAWGIITLLVLVFPANIQMSIDFYKKKNKFFWASVVRLPLQIPLIWWAYLYTN